MAHDEGHGKGRHAPVSVNARAIAWWGVALTALVAVTLLLMDVLLESFSARSQSRVAHPDGRAAAGAPTQSDHPAGGARPRLIGPGADTSGSPDSARAAPPEPRLNPRQPQELARLRARQTDRLNTYGWVDKGQNLVHIPIQRAMELLLERGLPVRGDAGDEK